MSSENLFHIVVTQVEVANKTLTLSEDDVEKKIFSRAETTWNGRKEEMQEREVHVRFKEYYNEGHRVVYHWASFLKTADGYVIKSSELFRKKEINVGDVISFEYINANEFLLFVYKAAGATPAERCGSN